VEFFKTKIIDCLLPRPFQWSLFMACPYTVYHRDPFVKPPWYICMSSEISSQGSFTKGGRTSSLLYIYSRCTCMELFQWLLAPLVLKFGIHQGQTGRKGVRRWEEEGMNRGHRDTLVETACRLCSRFCMGLIYCCPIQLGGEISNYTGSLPPFSFPLPLSCSLSFTLPVLGDCQI
jgi:hypothetical protein